MAMDGPKLSGGPAPRLPVSWGKQAGRGGGDRWGPKVPIYSHRGEQ